MYAHALIFAHLTSIYHISHIPQHPNAVALVRKLGDNSFDVRQEAHSELTKFGRSAIIAMVRGTKSGDLEVQYRAGMIIGKLVRDEMRKHHPYPMIDALWYNVRDGNYYSDDEPYHTRRCMYIRYVNDGGPLVYESDFDYDKFKYMKWRRASMLYVVDMIQAGVKSDVIRGTLIKMHRTDAIWMESHNIGCPIPFKDWTPYAK